MNKQNWKRVKHILKEDNFPRGYNGAAVPFIDKIKNNILKVYFSSRDKNNKTYIFWATFDIADNFSLLDMSTKPEFNLGNVGEFDENGSMGCQIFYKNNEKYLYYIQTYYTLFNLGNFNSGFLVLSLGRFNLGNFKSTFLGAALIFNPSKIPSNLSFILV